MNIQNFLKDLVGKNEQVVASENVYLKMEIENLRTSNKNLNDLVTSLQVGRPDHTLVMRLNEERYDAQQGRLYMMNEGKRIEREAQIMVENMKLSLKETESELNARFEKRVKDAKINEIVFIANEIPEDVFVFPPSPFLTPIDPSDLTNYDN